MLRKALLRVVVGIAAATVVSAAAARDGAKPLSISSNVDRKKVLPQRSRWLAYPVPAAQVARVVFLIDGKLRWVERAAPYTYGGDDGHGHLGYLVTSWLTGGNHRFTVRVTAKSGKAASNTVVARVVPARTPPAALAGEWLRTVTQQDLKSGPSACRGLASRVRSGSRCLAPRPAGLRGRIESRGRRGAPAADRERRAGGRRRVLARGRAPGLRILSSQAKKRAW